MIKLLKCSYMAVKHDQRIAKVTSVVDRLPTRISSSGSETSWEAYVMSLPRMRIIFGVKAMLC
jgi:hypothetical protein